MDARLAFRQTPRMRFIRTRLLHNLIEMPACVLRQRLHLVCL